MAGVVPDESLGLAGGVEECLRVGSRNAFIERGVRDGFIPAREGAWIAYDTDAGALLDRLAAAASDVEERPTEP